VQAVVMTLKIKPNLVANNNNYELALAAWSGGWPEPSIQSWSTQQTSCKNQNGYLDCRV